MPLKSKDARPFTLTLIIILCLAFLCSAYASISDTWTAKASMLFPVGPDSGQAAVLDGKIYALRSSPARIEVYEPDLDSWVEKSPPPLHDNMGFTGFNEIVACSGKIYVIGGPNMRSLQVYDPANDSWEIKTSMRNARYGFQPSVVDGKIYVIGGADIIAGEIYAIFGENEVYDPGTDSWSYMTQLPTTTAWYASAVVEDKIYIIGGLKSHQNPDGSRSIKFTNLVQIFDPKTNQWSNGTPMPMNMSKLAGSATTGFRAPERIYVVGGIFKDEGQTPFTYPEVNWTQIYDLETDSWSAGASLPFPRSGISLVNVNDKLYALGGSESTTNQEYTPIGYDLAGPSFTPETTLPNMSSSPVLPSPSIPEQSKLIVPLFVVVASTILIVLTNEKKRKRGKNTSNRGHV